MFFVATQMRLSKLGNKVPYTNQLNTTNEINNDMNSTKRQWEERHYKMVEESDAMFKTNTQGEEVDI